MNLALTIYLRSRKSYDEVRNSSFLVLPHPRTLDCVKSQYKVEEGEQQDLYSRIRQSVQHNDAVPGRLMFDEIKLKSGLAFNSKSKELVGVVDQSDQ